MRSPIALLARVGNVPDRLVQYRDEFRADVAARHESAIRSKPVESVGVPRPEQMALRRGRSYRVFGLGRLPYLVWYFYDVDRRAGPVWLAMIREKDRERSSGG